MRLGRCCEGFAGVISDGEFFSIRLSKVVITFDAFSDPVCIELFAVGHASFPERREDRVIPA